MRSWTRKSPAGVRPAGRCPGAFDRFAARFRPKIFQYSWVLCGDRDDADEVAQETLLQVFVSLDRLRDPERVRAWVLRIARNVCLMKRRKSIYAPAREEPLEEAESGPDCGPLPDRHGSRVGYRGIQKSNSLAPSAPARDHVTRRSPSQP